MSLKQFQQDLEQLANLVETEWSGLNFEEKVFPELAARALKSFSTEYVPDIDVCLNESPHITLPIQQFPNGEFSDFPLTLVKRENFFIDIYVWFKSDTNIHNHHFCGAFKVIAGSSVQIRYKFKTLHEIGPGLSEGEMTQEGHDDLPLNTVQAIDPRDEFIHNVFHTGKPTITLCLRTPSFKGEALDVFIYPKYKLKLTFPPVNFLKWHQIAKVAIAQGKTVESIPFSEVDIILMIYRHFNRLTIIDNSLLDLFEKQLEKLKVVEDFQTVLSQQPKFYAKLKFFGGL
jgi:hypothetical protein